MIIKDLEISKELSPQRAVRRARWCNVSIAGGQFILAPVARPSAARCSER